MLRRIVFLLLLLSGSLMAQPGDGPNAEVLTWERTNLGLSSYYPSSPSIISSVFGIDSILYARIGSGVYETSDLGESWTYRASDGDFGIEDHVFKTFYFNARAYPPYSSTIIYETRRSSSVFSPYEFAFRTGHGTFHYGSTQLPQTIPKNKDVLIRYGTTNSISGYGILNFHYSHNAGRNWEMVPLFGKPNQLSQLNDTTTFYRIDVSEDTLSNQDQLTFTRFGNDHFDDPIRDTLLLPSYLVASDQPIPQYLYLHGKHYLLHPSMDSLAISSDGTTWDYEVFPYDTVLSVNFYKHGILVRSLSGFHHHAYSSVSSGGTLLLAADTSETVHTSGTSEFRFFRTDNGMFRLDNQTLQLLPLNPIQITPDFPGTIQKVGNYLWYTDDSQTPSLVLQSPADTFDWFIPTHPGLADGSISVTSIDVSAAGTLYVTHQSQLWSSVDGGAVWNVVGDMPLGLNGIQGIHCGRIVTIEPGFIHYTTDEGSSWETIAMHPDDDFAPETLFLNGDTIYYGRSVLSGSYNFVQKGHVSFDHGQTWTMTYGSSSWAIPTQFRRSGEWFYRNDPTGYFHISNPCLDLNHSSAGKVPSVYVDPPNTGGAGGLSRSEYFVQDSFVVLTGDQKMYLSRDYGVSYTSLEFAPFGSIQSGMNLNYPLQHYTNFMANVGDAYFFTSEHMYVRSSGILWRTPLAHIANPALSQNLHGRVFRDLNENCQFDPGEDLAEANRPLGFNQFVSATNDDGWYALSIEPGNYGLDLATPPHYAKTCPVYNDSIYVALGVDTVDLPLTPLPGVVDLAVKLHPLGAFRPGQANRMLLTAENRGTVDVVDAPIKFWYDTDGVNFTSVIGGDFTGFDGDTLLLTADLLAYEHQTIELHFWNDTTLVQDDTRSFHAAVDATDDEYPADNLAAHTRTVTTSYDPNDKTATPQPGLLPLAPGDIDYLIRFQNTGADTAFRVVLLDTLPPQLDVLSLRTLHASHDYTFAVRDDRVAAWTFDDILLPDSLTNPLGSQGYVLFRATTVDSLPAGDTIRNEAAIYFDYNDPILTPFAETVLERQPLYRRDTVQICAGEPFNGTVFETSVTLANLSSGPQYDTIFQTRVVVFPVALTERDTLLPLGSIWLGETVQGPLTVSESLLTWRGCDSTVVWNVDVLVDSRNPGQLETRFSVQPNPGEAPQVLRLELPQTTTLSAELRDARGRSLRTLFTERRFPAGVSEIRVREPDLPAGVYLIHLTDGVREWTVRLVRQ